MIPLRDNIPSRTTPVVNFTLIGICTLVFLLQVSEESGARSTLIQRFGMIPARVFQPDQPLRMEVQVQDRLGRRFVRPVEVPPSPVSPWITLLTCIFLHGGWLHFLGNMWFLFIFGDNVEDRVGHLGYLLFYLFCGVLASVAHLLFNATSAVPTIGASGAIAGVMGAYFLLYPRAKVLSIFPIFFFIQIVVLPAPVFLGIWFLLQFLQGTVSTASGLQAGGVAWWSHIGGFVVGFAIAAILKSVGETRPPVKHVRPYPDRIEPHEP
ncbi:MAG: rhomboid family intramembrane serine protease [Planctomycetota bacterium]